MCFQQCLKHSQSSGSVSVCASPCPGEEAGLEAPGHRARGRRALTWGRAREHRLLHSYASLWRPSSLRARALRNSARMFSPSRPSAFSLSSSAFSYRPCGEERAAQRAAPVTPSPPRPPAPFPAEMEDAGEPGSGRGVPELQETALAFLLWSRASTSPADGAAHGRWQATGAAGPSNCTVMSVVFQTHLLPHLPSAQSAMDRE